MNEYTVDALIRSAVTQADSLGLRVPDARAFSEPVAYLAMFLEWFPEVLSVWQQGRLRVSTTAAGPRFSPGFCRRSSSGSCNWPVEGSVVVVTSAGVISTNCCRPVGENLAWQRELNVWPL